MTRPIEQQFGVKKARIIRNTQKLFQSLQFPTGTTALYYRSEIVNCLEVGLLLAAVHVASALLELFVRDLLVATHYKQIFSHPPKFLDYELHRIEKEIEDGRPRFDFNRIITELVQRSVIDPKDGDNIYDFYKSVRIPIHHGLTRRFIRTSSKFVIDEEKDDFFSLLSLNPLNRAKAFEEMIEDNSLDHLLTVGYFIEKYLPILKNLFSA